jgi:hypothetical protein
MPEERFTQFERFITDAALRDLATRPRNVLDARPDLKCPRFERLSSRVVRWFRALPVWQAREHTRLIPQSARR